MFLLEMEKLSPRSTCTNYWQGFVDHLVGCMSVKIMSLATTGNHIQDCCFQYRKWYRFNQMFLEAN